jgi:hypothetical protein
MFKPILKIVLNAAFYKNTYRPDYRSTIYLNKTDIKMQAQRKYYLEFNKQYYNTMTNELKKQYKHNIIKNIVNNNIHLL